MDLKLAYQFSLSFFFGIDFNSDNFFFAFLFFNNHVLQIYFFISFGCLKKKKFDYLIFDIPHVLFKFCFCCPQKFHFIAPLEFLKL